MTGGGAQGHDDGYRLCVADHRTERDHRDKDGNRWPAREGTGL